MSIWSWFCQIYQFYPWCFGSREMLPSQVSF